MIRLTALLLALVAAALLALPAAAATGPGKQKRAIQRAALALLPKADRKKVVIQDVKLASAGKRWAIASVNARRAYEATFQSFIVVLLKVPRIDDSTYWVVADFGNAFVGCGIAPVRVLRDLYGDRTPCAGA